MEEVRARLDATERRLQETSAVLQAQIDERRRVEETFEKTQKYAASIVETIREPLLVLAPDLKVISANQSFYQTFQVTPKETEGRFVYSIGKHQWDIPALRKLLEEIVPRNTHFNDFEVDHKFPAIGRRRILLNARRIHRQGGETDMILLAIEDITERKQMEEALEVSEVRFRRLFETAQDGILILDADTGQISNVNQFLIQLLGYSENHFLGKKLWEIGAFKDIKASKTTFSELQNKGYVRYEDLPLQTKDGRLIDVEFVSNVYGVDNKKVIQCNIRDITERKKIENTLREANERAVWMARFPEQNPNPVIRTSAEGTVLYCNPAATRLRGWACEVGKFLQNELLPLVGRATAEGKEVQQDVEIGERYYIVWVVPFPDERYVNIYSRDITERKQVENALKQTTERLEMAQHAAKVGTWDWDIAGGHAEWSTQLFDLFGLDPLKDTASFEVWKSILHPEEIETAGLRIEQALKQKTPLSGDFRIVLPDGQIRWINATGEAKYDDQGRPIRMIGICMDITERKKAEEALQTTFQRLYVLVSNLHNSILFVGEGGIELVNQKFCDYFELQDAPADLIGLTPDKLIKKIEKVHLHPEKEVTRIQEIIDRGQPVIGEEIALHDGRTCLRDFIPICVDGKSYGRLWHHTDITVRKQIGEALKNSETQYRRLFETAQDGILILDAKTGQISDVNPFLAETLGYSHEDFLGKKLWEIGAFKDIEASKAIFMKLQKKGYVRYEDLPLETKDGRPMAVEFVSNVYQVDHHKVIQCNIRDITERKHLGEALQKAHDELEKRVEERTVELQTALSEISTLKERLETENIYFRQENKMKHRFEHILGQSDGLKYVLYRAEQVAPQNTTVLILGETGTGKELIAAAIHNMSPRKDQPLITVNCAALPANLIESELFGREKGAFTGADTRRIGRFEVAHSSTLCLDEIGELPLEVQAKLLRVIQHNEFERLGSSQTVKVDVRIVATTNRNLEEEVRQGRFRQDLYYRLNVFPITVPPLRQRKDDIPLMVQAFIERYSRKLGKQITTIPKETMKELQDYPWPGNVRELESVIERAVILCPGAVLQLADKLEIASPPLSSAVRTLEETERNQILKILSETSWRIEGKDKAAAILGLHPSTLRARMHKLGIVRPETKKPD